MTRTMLIATGVVLVAVVAYFLVLDRTPGARNADITTQIDSTPGADAAVQENISNRAGSDLATDSAVESARAGEDPVQGSLESSRAAADAAGAVGGAAFTSEGYDRQTVLAAIDDSELTEAEKDELRDLVAATDPSSEVEMQTMLTTVRTALTEG